MPCGKQLRTIRRPETGQGLVPIGLILFFGLLLRVFLVGRNIELLMEKFLADDAFYYFALVKNIINGHGVVFNFGIATNGFHPLYALILIPLFRSLYAGGPDLPIYASLFLIAAVNSGTAVFLYSGLKKLAGPSAGFLAAFIWMFNPFVIFAAFMGTETALQGLFVSALICYLAKKTQATAFSLRESAYIGFLLGLIILSRLDGILIGTGVVIAIGLRKIRQGADQSPSRKVFPSDLAMIIIIALLMLLPWLAFSLVKVQRLTPVSGEAVRLLQLRHFPYPTLIKRSITTTGMFVSGFFASNLWFSSQTARLLAALLLLFFPPILLQSFTILNKDRTRKKLIPALDFLIIGSLVYYGGYWFYQMGIRPWYSIYTSLILTVCFSASVAGLLQFIRSEKMKNIVLAVIISLLAVNFTFAGFQRYRHGNFPTARLHREIALFLDKNIPDYEKIGSFNTGIFQYYSEKHDIINLDGVINPEAFRMMKEGVIEQYIVDIGISYIIDPVIYVEGLNRSVITFEAVQTFTMPPYGGKFYTYKLYKIAPARQN